MTALDTLIQQAQADLDLKNAEATKAAAYLTGLTDARDVLAAQAEVKPETPVATPKRRGRKPKQTTDATGLVTAMPPKPDGWRSGSITDTPADHPERPAFLDRKVTA